MPNNDKKSFSCSFCGKDESLVRQIVRAPNDICICDECIKLCSQVIGEETFDAYTAAETDFNFEIKRLKKRFVLLCIIIIKELCNKKCQMMLKSVSQTFC